MADSTSLHSTDSATLALLGKKQVLTRRFGLVSLIGFAVCELITWETVLALFSQSLDNGGPAGAIYGFMIAWASTLSVYMVISELASMAPIAGGQYYWVYMLAPPRWKTISSYLIGWLTSLAWIATVATETLFAGLMLQGVLILDYPNYNAEPYQGTLLTWGVIAICVFINVVIPHWLPRFEVFSGVFHIVGFIAVLTTLLVMTNPKASNADVWLTSNNGGGWPTQGLSYCVGFLGNVATFVGADASVHMAEEVANPAKNLPRAIIGAMLINGAVGFAMMITVLYCITDLDGVLGSATGFPFIQVFADSTNNIAGASVMTAVVLMLTWICATGITTTASRMTWSFARDRGLPFGRLISRVDQRYKVPYVAVFVVTILAALLTLIYIGSDVAFNDVVSLTITGFYGSYFVPAAFLLYHRIKGNVMPHGTREQDAASSDLAKATDGVPTYHRTVEVANAALIWGPWSIPGLLGTLNNLYACCYMIFVIFFSVWPPATPVDAESMNYSIVVTGGVLILSFIWYLAVGRREYKGPLIDDEVANVMRSGSVVAVQ
ncbi:hypothetical protein AMS68_005706 [Peltaster fructicola]|uniref:Amino acid permease/ SLC12A domain-containing protein n=1 Tax=Peltaster fructicola TaxID=286661 RepID=A0A6H0Y000_9PEZI|nr:hypothetical protein AMS68_005706 [Peltaster fructicola]